MIYISSKESDSLQSTNKKLIQSSDVDDEQVDEAKDLEFQYGVEHLYLREILEKEEVASRVRGGDTYGVVDVPHQEGVLEKDNYEGPFS